MGKIKIKTLGLEDEEQLKRQAKEKRDQKKLRQSAKLPGRRPAPSDAGLRGGEKIADASVSLEEFEEIERKGKLKAVKEAFVPPEKKEAPIAPTESGLRKGKQKKKEKPTLEEKAPIPPRKRSQAYQNATKLIDKSRLYSINEAIDLVKKTSYSKFPGTVEVHINCLENGVKVTVTLPHGTGKERKVVVCDDKILKEIEKGKINFDALVATPEFMPRLARFAKILGPKGLMPNPKQGTVTTAPDKVVAELKAGRTDLKTESAAPIIHTIIGKVDFDSKKLVENFNKLIEAIGKPKIKSVFLKATMGPSLKVALG